jgi:hypothetical protein
MRIKISMKKATAIEFWRSPESERIVDLLALVSCIVIVSQAYLKHYFCKEGRQKMMLKGSFMPTQDTIITGRTIFFFL